MKHTVNKAIAIPVRELVAEEIRRRPNPISVKTKLRTTRGIPKSAPSAGS